MANKIVSAKEKKENTSEKVDGFLKNNRVVLLSVICALVVAAVVVGVVFGVSDSKTTKNLAAIDSIEFAYINGSDSLEENEFSARQNAALESLKAYTDLKGIAGVRANMLAGSVAGASKDFAASAEYWLKAAELNKKAYTAPLAYYNAAAAYEEINDNVNAANYYEKAAEYKFELTPHAIFNMGRAKEAAGDVAGAVAAYQKLIDEYSTDNWTYLAQSRIIKLAAEGKTE